MYGWQIHLREFIPHCFIHTVNKLHIRLIYGKISDGVLMSWGTAFLPCSRLVRDCSWSMQPSSYSIIPLTQKLHPLAWAPANRSTGECWLREVAVTIRYHGINLSLSSLKILIRKEVIIMVEINPLSTLFVGIDVSSKNNVVYAMDFNQHKAFSSSFANS